MTLTHLSAHVVRPQKQNQRATLYVKSCTLEAPLENCPFLKKQQCLHSNSPFGATCAYGHSYSRASATMRARRYYKDVQKLQEEANEIESLVQSTPPACMAFIGDYVYLPYGAINPHYDKAVVPFLRQATGFMKKEDFTPENIVKLLTFRPQALFGGEILSYRQEELPRFIFHLRYLYPDIFEQVAEIFPKLRQGLAFIEKHITLDKVPLSAMPAGSGNEHGYEIHTKREQTTVEDWNPETGVLTLKKVQANRWLFSFENLEVEKGSDVFLTCKPDPESTYVRVSGEELKKYVLVNYPQHVRVEKRINLNWKTLT